LDDTILAYCMGEVRRHHPDRYLASLFAPKEAREALFALYAFDHEIAKVRHVVSEPMAGLIRFQWWRDALDGIERDQPLAHPVVMGLYEVFQRFPVARSRLDRAIDAREDDLSKAPATVTDAEARLERTSAGITQAALEILGASGEAEMEAGRRVGLARGWQRLLATLPADLRRRRFPLPVAELTRHGIDVDQLTDGAADEPIRALVSSLAESALNHLRSARRSRTPVAAAALPALLPAVSIEAGLARLRQSPAAVTPPSPWVPVRILLRWSLGRF
jgi:NADH dehydrogenase [ubiquinone] 1 alpha subcomplex assembly factor 6